MPVLLLGDDGCGKTHLLYSVVNQIRSGSARTGLAYVTAREFPDKVRGLIKDPTPVQRAGVRDPDGGSTREVHDAHRRA